MSNARVLTLEEAEEWCDYNSPSRANPVWQEYVQTWTKEKSTVLERIDPQSDFDTADMVGYGETNRLWSEEPTAEQMKNTPWEN